MSDLNQTIIDDTLTVEDIKKVLSKLGLYKNVFVPEFTWKDKRVDCLLIDISHRWIRGFEIKISRSDFLRDDKFLFYTEFCSSLSLVCPAGLIKPEEIEKPIGLVWIQRDKYGNRFIPHYVKRPKNFQVRKSLSWFWTYVKVLETEFPRLVWENDSLKANR